jgi:hypothetical protein
MGLQQSTTSGKATIVQTPEKFHTSQLSDRYNSGINFCKRRDETPRACLLWYKIGNTMLTKKSGGPKGLICYQEKPSVRLLFKVLRGSGNFAKGCCSTGRCNWKITCGTSSIRRNDRYVFRLPYGIIKAGAITRGSAVY